MTRALALLVPLVLGACDAPAPSLRIAFAGPPSQACPSTDCALVEMNCPAVMSIRIVDPADADPTHPLHQQCREMTPDGHHDMCVVAFGDLTAKPLPVRDLEVQIAVYPTTAIAIDPTDMSLICPDNVRYSAATGFPVEQAPTPALGGRAYYHPGDQTVTVTLGCTDLNAINASCAGAAMVGVTASLENFEDRFPVTDVTTVEALEVSAGEPRTFNNAFELNPNDTTRLMLQINGNGRPTWEGEVQAPLNRYACLRVRDNAAQSTATVTCKAVTPDQPLELVGALMGKKSLDELLNELQLPEFPAHGLTVGIVVDEIGDPVTGAVVMAKQHAVAYETPGSGFSGVATSARGIFVSTDAPFGTEFTTDVMIDGTRQSFSGVGGLIDGMVTVVILRPSGQQL